MRNKYFYLFFSIIFIFIVWGIFGNQYFLHDRVPYPAKYQDNFFKPWSAYPEYGIPVQNTSLSDVVDEIYPWKHFTIETLKEGQIPFWNPYSFSGTPHMANYQSSVFSPFNVFFFVLPFVDGWSMFILIQPLLAGLFMFLFLRELQRTRIASLIGSVAFMFCGFIITWVTWGTLSMTIAFLPLCLFVIEKTFRTNRVEWSILLSVGLASAFFSGHLQISLYLVVYTFFYLLYKFIQTKKSKEFIWLSSFFLLGIAITLIQIIPSLQLYSYSPRSGIFNNQNGIPWYYLITVFAPDFYGNPVTRNDWLGYYGEWASFIGIIPFTLAVNGIIGSERRKETLFFFTFGISTLLLSLNSPVQDIITSFKIPVFSTSIPSRIIILFSFSFAVLSAFGLDAIKEQIRKPFSKKTVLPFILLSLLFIVIWYLLVVYKVLPYDKASLSMHNFVLPTVIFFTILSMYLLIFFIKKEKLILAFCVILLLITVGDSLRFAMKWLPFDPKEFVFPDLPVISAMKQYIGQGREFGNTGAFLDTYYHLPSIEGYDPLYNKYYGEFIQTANTGKFANAQKSTVSLDRRGKYTDRVLDLLNVTLILHAISDTNMSWAYPVWDKNDKYTLVYHDNKFELFFNTTAMPRAKLFYNYEVITKDKTLLEQFYSADFNYRNILLLKENPDLKIVSRPNATGSAKLVSFSPNRVIISTHSSQPALLFLSDTYYPQWKATVNGKSVKIFQSDYAFRSVIVPQGDSTVVFIYSGLF